MKVKLFSLLAALALFAACENPFVTKLLPDRDGDESMLPGSFVVTFNKNGGTTEASPRTKVVTPPTTTIGSLPTAPTWAGYTFNGWNTQSNGSGSPFTASTPVTKSITVYARWTQGGGPSASVIVDFENYALGPHSGVVKGYNTQGEVLTPTVNIVNDPVNAGQKSMSISSTDYGQAAIVPITLPAALNTAESFTFRFLLPSGTISYKKVLVYIASSADTFVTGGFGNAANNPNGYAEFAANKLGETAEEINNSDENANITLNEWKTYTISINGASLNPAIKDLSGEVYLAIGIHHSSTEAITYLLDDLTFTFRTGPIGPSTPAKVDFEIDNVGKTYEYTEGDAAPSSVKVVSDPVTSGQKSLEIVSGNYNQAAIVPINLPNTVNSYSSFTFRFYLQSGTLENKDMMVYVAADKTAFKKYGFGNADGNNNFTANLLGSVKLDNATSASSAWKTYTITISNPGSAISGLSGDVYLAIGINQNGNITYLLDDLTFTDAPPPPAPTLVDFENDVPGAAANYSFTRGDNDPHEFLIVADPVPSNGSAQSLKMTTGQGNNSNDPKAWNQAVVIPINIPDPLNTYLSFRFRFNLGTSGTLMNEGNPRKIQVYVADNTAAFIRYAFGNPSSNSNQFANLLLGEIEPDYNKTGQWVDYAVNFTAGNLGNDIKNLTGNVYVAIGINHSASITYHLDDLSFNKQELIKQDGAPLTGLVTVNVSSITPSSVTINTIAAPGNGQTVEYAVSTGTTEPTSGWQDSPAIAGLTANTSYYAWARSKSNALFKAGTAIRSASTFTTLGKLPGGTVDAPTLLSKTHSRITVNAVTPPGNGQTVEYAISEGMTAPESGWQAETTFRGLDPSTPYYVFARTAENGNNSAGAASNYLSVTTDSYTPPPVPPSVVNFEDKNINDTYNRVSGQGSTASTAAVVADPASAAEKSLRITSSGWNNGVIIPINLPFALKNYESFTFRYRLATSMPDNSNRGNGIWVYVTNSTSGLPGNQLGNNNTSYTNILLKNIVPDYNVTNQWVDAEISLMSALGDSTVLSGIQNLQGDVFLIIGINSAQTIEYYLDDLTFNIYEEFEPTPSITPTTATFALSDQKDIDVTMNLYGHTFVDITGGSPAIQASNYSRSGDVITLKKEYLLTQTVGSTVPLTFNFSGGKTSTIAITISATSLITAYNFATMANGTTVGAALVGSGSTMSFNVQGGVLEVKKTNTNHTTAVFTLPFKLGTTTLSEYSRIEVVIRGVGTPVDGDTTDYANKTTTATLQPAGTTIVSFGNSGLSTTFKTIAQNITGGGTATGDISIGFSLGQTKGYTIEIQSITLVK